MYRTWEAVALYRTCGGSSTVPHMWGQQHCTTCGGSSTVPHIRRVEDRSILLHTACQAVTFRATHLRQCRWNTWPQNSFLLAPDPAISSLHGTQDSLRSHYLRGGAGGRGGGAATHTRTCR